MSGEYGSYSGTSRPEVFNFTEVTRFPTKNERMSYGLDST